MTYNEFIDSILESRGRFGITEGYKERHHIIPRCLNGSDEKNNLIDLYANEHFIAHYLLAKENPDEYKLSFALYAMLNLESGIMHRKINLDIDPYIYEDARIMAAKAVSFMNSKENLSEERLEKLKHPKSETHKQHIREALIGREIPERTRKAVSESNKKRIGENHPMWGKKYSDEWRNHISEALKNSPNIKGENHHMYGKHHSEEIKEKIRIKNRINSSGEKNPMYGKTGKNNPNFGKHRYNNGIKEISVFDDEVPEGFIKGRLKKKIN